MAAVLYSHDSISVGSDGASAVLSPARGRCSGGLYPAPHITHTGELQKHPRAASLCTERGEAVSRRRGTLSYSLLGGGVWELVLWWVPDAACSFRDVGCRARRTASPPLLPAALAVLAGKEKAIEVVTELQERPGMVTAGDSHSRGQSRPGLEGMRRSRRGGMEV